MTRRRMTILVIALGLSASAQGEDTPQKTPAELMPITTANLRGHEALYHEGWFIVSSTERALQYAKQQSIVATGKAMTQLQNELAANTRRVAEGITQAGTAGARAAEQIYTEGSQRSKDILSATRTLGAATWEFGGEAMEEAWQQFVRGNLSLVRRTQKDRAALMELPGGYFKNLSGDFHELVALSKQAKQQYSTHIEGRWSDAYREAVRDFDQAYSQSGTRSNSLAALGDILAGYLNVLYSGIIKPATRSTVQAGEATAKVVGEMVFLPTASLFIVSGRTIQSVGLSLYYTTSLGVSLVSPTIEGGLLAGLSLLSFGATPAIYAVGGSMGAVNQIAVTAAAPIAGAGRSLVQGSAEALQYAALVGYDTVSGVAKVSFHQVNSGVALGYNALTALPTQLVLGAANSVMFLAWDGPRLIIASAKGEVRWRGNGSQRSLPVQSLPVGSVVDLQALRKEAGVEVKTVSDDPEVVQRVLEKLPEDLRVGDPR